MTPLPIDLEPVVSTAVLEKFRPWTGTVPRGYFVYFLGNRARADYWAFPAEIRRLYDRERVESFSGPSIDDNIFDWLILLEAVVEARNDFTMVALGAGWGRWLVAAALAVRQLSDIPIRLVGVEAEPTHFQWMKQHFRDNGIDPEDHDLIEAAVSSRNGLAWFYFGKPDAWYGQSVIQDETLDCTAAAGEIDYNGEKAKLVRSIDICEILQGHSRVDYLHMDVQGVELDVLSKDPQLLSRKVKRVLVGTHSGDIEIGLRQLFGSLNWHRQYDIPLNGVVTVGNVAVTLGDGVQVWINPEI